MALRDWGIGRLILTWVAYWIILAAAAIAAMGRALRGGQADPPPGDYLNTIAAFSLVWPVLLVVGPPVASLAVWLWSRRA